MDHLINNFKQEFPIKGFLLFSSLAMLKFVVDGWRNTPLPTDRLAVEEIFSFLRLRLRPAGSSNLLLPRAAFRFVFYKKSKVLFS
jgi:hypothetical protein